jgi:hypothetical protein
VLGRGREGEIVHWLYACVRVCVCECVCAREREIVLL